VKPSLALVEDVAGERLVLAAPPSGAINALREMLVSGSRSASSFAREISQRPRSPRELLVSFGLVLLVLSLCALVLLACFMALVGGALVVVLYAIGIWVVAWLLVPAVARSVIDARSESRTRARLTGLSFARESGEITWRGASAGSCSFASLSSLRLSIRSQAGESSEIALQLLLPERASATRLHFSVTRVDREEEAFDLCMRMARVLSWHAFATTRDHLQGLEIELRPAAPAGRAHPFRSYAAAPRFHAIGATTTTATDWSASVEPGFREPIEPPPPFVVGEIASAKARVPIWNPGRVVELRAGRSVGAARIAWGLVVATCVALALPLSVLVMINAAGGLRLLETQQGGRTSFAGVTAIFTRFSAGAGWLLALALAVRRTGRSAATFDWGSRELAIRDDRGRHVVAFSEIVALVLTETSDRRYALSAALKARSPRLLLESEPASSAAEPYLALTIELARALGVAWRCNSDAA